MQETWIDGFNLFHKWSRTRRLFRRGGDIARAQTRALSMLADALGKHVRFYTVFMDGGLRYEAVTVKGLKVRYPGPGKKADELLVETMNTRKRGRVGVVTGDRSLAANLRAHGAKIIDAEAFIRNTLVSAPARTEDDQAYRDKQLSPDEVNLWLREFEEDDTHDEQP